MAFSVIRASAVHAMAIDLRLCAAEKTIGFGNPFDDLENAGPGDVMPFGRRDDLRFGTHNGNPRLDELFPVYANTLRDSHRFRL